jgi:dipeptide transport system substrate-binding protein
MNLAWSSSLVYCSEGSPESFNPQRTLSGTARNATAGTIYNRLVEFEQKSTRIVPSLAESWQVSEDKTVYRFKLRKGVQFHSTKYFTPTREFTADDVIFSFNRQLIPEHSYHMVGGGTYQYFQGMGMDKLIKSIKKQGDYQIEITLNHPEAPFIANLAMPFMSILSGEYAENLTNQNEKNKLDILPIGTGPFVYKRYLKDSSIRFKAHPNYWEGQSDIKDLIFSITPDASVRYQKMKKSECQIAVYPAPADLKAIKKNKNLKLIEMDGMNIGYLALNTEKAPFNQVKVRQAIAHALNKQSYIDAIYMGNAIQAINPYPPSMWAYNKNVDVYELNIEKAKNLLTEAGYPNGFSTTLWTLPVNRPYNPNGRKMGEMMQQDLAKVGIKVELSSYDWGTYLDKVKRGEHDMVQMGWTGDNGDPDNFLYTLFSCDSVQRGSNNSRYCQKEFNDLISQARIESSIAVREKLYAKALKVFSTDVPVIPIAHAKVYRIVDQRVIGDVMNPFEMDVFHKLTVSE